LYSGDADNDGYITHLFLYYDLDDWNYSGDTIIVSLRGYGRCSPDTEYLLFEEQHLWICGLEWPPWDYASIVTVPFKDEWSFRLCLTDTLGDSFDGWPYDCDSTLFMSNVKMETDVLDLPFLIFGDSARMLDDYSWDGDVDGYPRNNVLAWKIMTPEYSGINIWSLKVRIWARDEYNNEIFVKETNPFDQNAGVQQWHGCVVSTGRHGLWDFRIDLIDPFDELSDSLPYGSNDSIMNVKMEWPIEDPPVTVVFNPNPVNRANDHSLRDLDDGFQPILNQLMDLVDLQGLEMDVYNEYHLVGPHVRIDSSISQTYPRAVSIDTIFPYYRSEKQFEEVMCYYHIDTDRRYLQSMGFEHTCDYQIGVFAHSSDDNWGADFYPQVLRPGEGWLVFGDGGVDWAEDADIIHHEYAHAIQHYQLDSVDIKNPTLKYDRGHGNEFEYMKEGFAFYWASSQTDSASEANGFPSEYNGEWASKGYEPDPPEYLYTIGEFLVYPYAIVDTTIPNWKHLNGEIWGGALWDIFQAIGKRITDSLVLHSHEILMDMDLDTLGFQEGALAIVKAEMNGYYGVHGVTVHDLFSGRGILPCCDCGAWGDLDGSGTLGPPDCVYIVNYVYKQQDARSPQLSSCPWEPGDANCDGRINGVDVVNYVNSIYKNYSWALVNCTDLDGLRATNDDIGCQ